jgi:catechol 2,3-dioxygenase-like lactoylglutathione lyase family enzyme
VILDLVSPLEVGISVRDMDTMSRFYRERLGLRHISTLEVSPQLGEDSTFSSAGYRIMRLQLRTGERLKLVEAGRAPIGDAASGEVLDRQGIAFLTFIVADLRSLVDRLLEAGVEVSTGRELVEIRDGVFVAFALDPEGNRLELVEYADLGSYRSDLPSS